MLKFLGATTLKSKTSLLQIQLKQPKALLKITKTRAVEQIMVILLQANNHITISNRNTHL